MVKNTCRATPIPEKPLYEYTIILGEKKISLKAEEYTTSLEMGDENSVLEFRKNNEIIAIFRGWNVVYKNDVISSASES
jgi:hypothetical protein